MAKKYMLVRKSKEGNWKPCGLYSSRDEAEIGETSEDKALVDRDRNMMARKFPEQTYAVLEITEE